MNRLLLLLMLFSWVAGTAFAEDSSTVRELKFVRKESADNDVWYSNLTTKAIQFYGKACESGERDTCFKLGMIFDTGEMSVQDKARAAEAYQLACNRGSADGCNNLGVLYGTGDGVGRDLARASTFFTMSCELKEEVGCVNQNRLMQGQLEARH